MKDKRISHTGGFSVLVAAQSSAKQPSKFAQAPESFTAATENWAGSYKTPASGSISWPWLGEVKAAAEMWQQSATDAAFPSTYGTIPQTVIYLVPGKFLKIRKSHPEKETKGTAAEGMFSETSPNQFAFTGNLTTHQNVTGI